MRDKACEGCAHYDEKKGECHKKAPRIEGWPKVKPDDWCSEFLNVKFVYVGKIKK